MFYIFFWLRVLDKAEYSAFESTLNSSVVSYQWLNLVVTNLKVDYASDTGLV